MITGPIPNIELPVSSIVNMKKIVIILSLLFVVIFVGLFMMVSVILPDIIPVLKRQKNPASLSDKTFLTDSGDMDDPETDSRAPVTVDLPDMNSYISSPLTISGTAPGVWFVDNGFPVNLLDGTGRRLALGSARPEGVWSKDSLVPFTAELEFVPPATEDGSLVFSSAAVQNGNESDSRYSVTVHFAETTAQAGETCQIDSDCQVPPAFALRSNCPYEAKCLYEKCTVVCELK